MTTQQAEALTKANEIRMDRARLKAEVHAGQTTVAEVLREQPGRVESMKVAELLRAQYGWGEGRVRKALVAVNASRYLHVSELTDRQRTMICHFAGGA